MEENMDSKLFIEDEENLYVYDGQVFKVPFSLLKETERFSNFGEVLEATLSDVRKLGGPANHYWKDSAVDCETCPHIDGIYDCQNEGSGLVQKIGTTIVKGTDKPRETSRFMLEFPICSVSEALFLNLYSDGQMDSYKIEGVQPVSFLHRNNVKIGDERVPKLASLYEALRPSK